MKWCYQCRTDKPLGEFGKDKSRSDGYCAVCKVCRVEMKVRRRQPDYTPQGRLPGRRGGSLPGHSQRGGGDKATVRGNNFWAYVDRGGPDVCWVWKGSKLPSGYGRVSWQGKTTYAHRVAHLLAHGAIPAGMCVCHHCDNPPCCNPSHLWLGTQQDNMADRDRKGRTARGSQANRSDVKGSVKS